MDKLKEKYEIVVPHQTGNLEGISKRVEAHPIPQKVGLYSGRSRLLLGLGAAVVAAYCLKKLTDNHSNAIRELEAANANDPMVPKIATINERKMVKRPRGVQTLEDIKVIGFEGNKPVGIEKGEVRVVTNKLLQRVEITEMSRKGGDDYLLHLLDYQYLHTDKNGDVRFDETGHPIYLLWLFKYFHVGLRWVSIKRNGYDSKDFK